MQTTLFPEHFLAELNANSYGLLAKPLGIARRFLDTPAGQASLAAIDADLDRHAVGKKRRRSGNGKAVLLRPCGRPRTPAPVVYFLMVASGVIDDCFGDRGYALLVGSCDLHRTLAEFGVSKVPARSTCHELIGALSEHTLEQIAQGALAIALAENLDDFQVIGGDSTATEADSAKPNNARLFVHLAQRLFATEQKLEERLGLRRRTTRVTNQLTAVCDIKYKLLCRRQKPRVRIKLYKRLLYAGTLFLKFFEHKALDAAIGTVHEPMYEAMADDYWALEAMWFQIYQEIYPDAELGDDLVIRRSVADTDAAFIKKGHRPTVFGYRPHLARSANGFVAAFDLQRGNPSDASRFTPLLRKAIDWTGVVPDAVTFDSGYASRKNIAAAEKLGVANVSFSGATGKAIISAEQWESETFVNLRVKHRNALEALISNFKRCRGLKRFTVRNHAAARRQLLIKIIAYNFERTAVLLLRRQKAQQRDLAEKPAA